MRQRRWLELIKDYDLEVHYHPGKANVVADALSRKAQCNCASTDSKITTLCDELCKLNMEVVSSGALSYISAEPTLHEKIVMAQIGDKCVQVIKDMLKQKVDKYKCFRQDIKGILWFGDRLVVPKNPEHKKKILDEAHLSKFSMHPGSNKMYHDLRSLYRWTRMKREIAKYISECDTCMDFIVDRLTKTAHFLPVHTTHKTEKYAEIYVDQIVRLHGIPRTIVSDRGAMFVARFWEQLQKSLGTTVIRSSAYHPQTDGQTERVNQILEDMLRACVLHYGKNWDKCLSLAEFSYNNSYQSSLKMAPFKALYGKRCRIPLNCSQAGEREIFGPDLVLEAEEKVRVIKKNLEAAQARQKSYHDKRRKPLQFEVGDHVYLKVSPTKDVQRFGIKGKLAHRYIGPYEIKETCGPVAYQLKLPPHVLAVHDVFHVS
jgi:hypothetical protein